MSARENLSPGFSITHSIPEIFPSRGEFETFGYEPLDVYLTEDIDETTLYDARTFMEGEESQEFFDNFRDDYMLVFRYVREDVDPVRDADLPENPDMPAFKAESYPVSLRPDKDMLDLENLISEASDPISDSFYSQALDITEKDDTRRYKDPEGYIDVASDSEIILTPETYGLSEVELNPGNASAMMFIYEDETRVPSKKQGFRNYGIDEDPFETETVEVNREDEEIDRVAEDLRSIGFEVKRALIPPDN